MIQIKKKRVFQELYGVPSVFPFTSVQISRDLCKKLNIPALNSNGKQ